MTGYAGFSAIPGSMRPGAIWPGNAQIGHAGALTFTPGEPYFQWASGTPHQQWAPGVPYVRWAAGSAYVQWAPGEPGWQQSAGSPVLS